MSSSVTSVKTYRSLLPAAARRISRPSCPLAPVTSTVILSLDFCMVLSVCVFAARAPEGTVRNRRRGFSLFCACPHPQFPAGGRELIVLPRPEAVCLVSRFFLPAFWPVRPAIGRCPGSAVPTVRKKRRSRTVATARLLASGCLAVLSLPLVRPTEQPVAVSARKLDGRVGYGPFRNARRSAPHMFSAPRPLQRVVTTTRPQQLPRNGSWHGGKARTLSAKQPGDRRRDTPPAEAECDGSVEPLVYAGVSGAVHDRLIRRSASGSAIPGLVPSVNR